MFSVLLIGLGEFSTEVPTVKLLFLLLEIVVVGARLLALTVLFDLPKGERGLRLRSSLEGLKARSLRFFFDFSSSFLALRLLIIVIDSFETLGLYYFENYLGKLILPVEVVES